MVKSTKIFTAIKTPHKDSHCICLTTIVLNSVCKIKNKDDKYCHRFTWNSTNMKKRKQRKRIDTSKDKQ